MNAEIQQPIDILLITGFLGTGKTTLVNHLLSSGFGEGAGLLVNDFGDSVVDGSLIRQESEGSGMAIYEVAGGSIFCTCKSENFAAGLRMFADMQPSSLIVEASGMADPSGMDKLLSDYRLAASFQVARVICVTDAVNTPKVLNHLPALERQIESADLILINKSDLAEEESLQKFEAAVKKINPDAAVQRTIRSKVSLEDLQGGSLSRRGELESCNAPDTRPGTLQIVPENPSKDALDAFLHDILPATWRIKGWITASERCWYVSDNAGYLEWNEAELPRGMNPGLTVITPPGEQDKVKVKWEEWSAGRSEKPCCCSGGQCC